MRAPMRVGRRRRRPSRTMPGDVKQPAAAAPDQSKHHPRRGGGRPCICVRQRRGAERSRPGIGGRREGTAGGGGSSPRCAWRASAPDRLRRGRVPSGVRIGALPGSKPRCDEEGAALTGSSVTPDLAVLAGLVQTAPGTNACTFTARPAPSCPWPLQEPGSEVIEIRDGTAGSGPESLSVKALSAHG